jgi:hypothetical protein
METGKKLTLIATLLVLFLVLAAGGVYLLLLNTLVKDGSSDDEPGSTCREWRKVLIGNWTFPTGIIIIVISFIPLTAIFHQLFGKKSTKPSPDIKSGTVNVVSQESAKVPVEKTTSSSQVPQAKSSSTGPETVSAPISEVGTSSVDVESDDFPPSPAPSSV